MNWQEYLDYTRNILESIPPPAPYDHPDYYHYTRMNEARMKRWVKGNPVTEHTKAIVESIQAPQQWIVITEPWCGDAAHIVPVIYLMSALNSKITFELQLRDSHSEIEKYLTGNTRSIPMLVVRDMQGKDLFHWGPRPAGGQQLYLSLKERNAGFEEVKTAIQHYYNADKSLSMQNEIAELLRQYS